MKKPWKSTTRRGLADGRKERKKKRRKKELFRDFAAPSAWIREKEIGRSVFTRLSAGGKFVKPTLAFKFCNFPFFSFSLSFFYSLPKDTLDEFDKFCFFLCK